MSDFTNIPTGLKIPSQIPLNVKEFIQDENTLKNLGPLNNLAFTYHKGLRVYCITEKTIYEWNEVISGQENTGLLVTDFVYPNNVIVFGIDYSNKRYTFKKIIENTTIQNIGSGYGWFKELSNNVNKFKSLIVTTMGGGMSLFKDVQNNLNDLTIRLKSLKSNSVLISESNDTIYIELPQTNTSSNSIFVNNGYHPNYEDFHIGNEWKGEGTSARPFTDTHNVNINGTYTITPNTAIQNALDYYNGNNTTNNPQRIGQIIIIQSTPTGGYTFNGDLNYSGLRLINQSNIVSTNTGFIIDMDDNVKFKNIDRVEITTEENCYWSIVGKVKNSGNSIATNTYTQGKSLVFKGTGVIYEVSAYQNNTHYVLNSDPDGNINGTTGNHNDGAICIILNGAKINSLHNGVSKIGGQGSLECNNNAEISSSNPNEIINPQLKAYVQNGGTIRLFNSTIFLSGSLVRDEGFVFNPTTVFPSDLLATGCTFQGVANKWFSKTNNINSGININSCKTLFFGGANLFWNTGVDKWNVLFDNNYFESINVDFSKVDFTNFNNISSVNKIGNNIVECLVKFPNRVTAKTVLGENKAFLNTNNGDVINSSWKRDITL